MCPARTLVSRPPGRTLVSRLPKAPKPALKLAPDPTPKPATPEPAPKPAPEPGEVLLKSEAVGICGSDVHGFTGESGRRKPGMIMGHEIAGRVEELGNGVDSLDKGDVVAVYNLVSCGKCTYCLQGREQICPEKRIILRGGFFEIQLVILYALYFCPYRTGFNTPRIYFQKITWDFKKTQNPGWIGQKSSIFFQDYLMFFVG